VCVDHASNLYVLKQKTLNSADVLFGLLKPYVYSSESCLSVLASLNNSKCCSQSGIVTLQGGSQDKGVNFGGIYQD